MRKCIISTTGSGTLKHDLERFFDIHRFVNDLRAYRRNQQLTFAQMAELSGLDGRTISMILSRSKSPTFVTAIVLANMADLLLDWYRKDPHGDYGRRMDEIKARSRATSTSWSPVH